MTKRKTEGSPKKVDAGKQENISLEYSQQAAADMFATADVSRVYGKPIKHEGTTIIPAAEVLWAGGFAAGSGFGESPVGEDHEVSSGASGGSGGGGRTLARPVAVIIASEEGVRVEPIIDPTKIFMAALTAGGFMAAMAFRMMSPRRALRKLESK